MPTMDEYLARPLADRLERLRTTASDLKAAIDGKSDAVLSRRPDAHNWSAKEIVCHLRDVEELFLVRFQTMLAMEAPTILTLSAPSHALAAWGIGEGVGHPLDPDRWAEERQYKRCDTDAALAAFERRRGETLTLLGALTPAAFTRGGIHPLRGRMALGEWTASLAGHDDNHLEQLTRTLDAHPEAVTIESLSGEAADAHQSSLVALLKDSVDGGASVGFLPPLEDAEAIAYWQNVLIVVAKGSRLLWIAREPDGMVAGSVQLDLETRPNGNHRAEIMKLMVHSSRRRRGIGRALMLAAEAEARRLGRTTLVLDTRPGDSSEWLYRALGWELAGVIPRYARSADGALDPSAFYYRLLDSV